MTDRDAWWGRAFGPLYVTVYAHRDDPSARPEAAFAVRALGPAPGCRVLDAGCGTGRHARALAATGLQVVGADRSPGLLAEAAARGGGPRYVLADFRALPFRSGAFDHVVSFFTSFGYFDAAGDAAHASSLRRVLRPGGSMLLDFLNAPHVATTLVPESERRVGGVLVVERRRVRAGRVEKHVEVSAPGRATERWSESVRLYGRDELEGLLARSGFRVAEVFGDLAGAPWTERSPRLVVKAVAA